MTVVSTVRQPPFPGSSPERKDIMAPGYSYRQPVVRKPTEQPAEVKPPVVQPEQPKPE